MRAAVHAAAPLWRCCTAALAGLATATAEAHSFTQAVARPLPVATSHAAVKAAALLSVLFLGIAAVLPTRRGKPACKAEPPMAADERPSPARWIVLGLLAACVASGLAGTQNRFANLGMTLFWIVFAVALPLLVPLCGDFYARVNPWAALVDLLGRIRHGARPRAEQGSGCASYAIAAGLYAIFCWYGLFSRPTPRATALVLLLFTALNVGGAWLVGRHAWFRRCEPFSVLCSLLERLRPGMSRRAAEADEGWGLAFFVAVLLSTVTVDAAFPRIEATLTAAGLLDRPAYRWWGAAAIAIFVAAYWLALAAAAGSVKAVSGLPQPSGALSARFAQAVLPLAVALFAAHNFTLLLAHASQLPRLLSDPIGLGWDLLGSARWNVQPIILDAAVVWNIQVVAVVAGHLCSLAQVRSALSELPAARRIALSQLLLFLLLLSFTAASFWALSMPAPAHSHQDLLD